MDELDRDEQNYVYDCTNSGETTNNLYDSQSNEIVSALSPRLKPKIITKVNIDLTNINDLAQKSQQIRGNDKENYAMQISLLPPLAPADEEPAEAKIEPQARESPGRTTAQKSKDKRGRPSNARKEKRRMREKRRSTGVVHLHMSTEVTV